MGCYNTLLSPLLSSPLLLFFLLLLPYRDDCDDDDDDDDDDDGFCFEKGRIRLLSCSRGYSSGLRRERKQRETMIESAASEL